MIYTELQLTTENIECSINIKDKYCLISGFSGSGKSLFIQELEESINIKSDSLICDYPIIVISTVAELDVIDLSGKTYVLASDEMLAHDVLLRVQDTNSYAVCVTRKVYKDINYSDRCLYKAERDDVSGKTSIYPQYQMHQCENPQHFEKVIVEDSSAGYEFIKRVLSDVDVVSSYGKVRLCDIVRRNDYEDKNVLVICDRGGIGSIYSKLYKLLSKKKNLRLLMPECFEHILLCSEFIAHPIDILSHFELKYNNTENFCECRIAELTEDKPYMYNHNHGQLSMCWVKDCSICGRNCDYSVSGDKVQSVLKNGPASVLLEYYKRNGSDSQTADDVLDKFAK